MQQRDAGAHLFVLPLELTNRKSGLFLHNWDNRFPRSDFTLLAWLISGQRCFFVVPSDKPTHCVRAAGSGNLQRHYLAFALGFSEHMHWRCSSTNFHCAFINAAFLAESQSAWISHLLHLIQLLINLPFKRSYIFKPHAKNLTNWCNKNILEVLT